MDLKVNYIFKFPNFQIGPNFLISSATRVPEFGDIISPTFWKISTIILFLKPSLLYTFGVK